MQKYIFSSDVMGFRIFARQFLRMKPLTFTLLLFALLLCTACNRHCPCTQQGTQNEDHYFQYIAKESDSIVPFSFQGDIQCLKANIFISDENLYIGLPYYIDTLQDENQIVQKKVGTILFNPVDYGINIDTASYQFIVKDMIAKDENHVYAYPKGLFKLPFIQVLDLNPAHTIVLDHEATYLRDDSLVYCFPTNTYLDVKAKDFEVIYIQHVPFGKYHSILYYWDEPQELPTTSE